MHPPGMVHAWVGQKLLKNYIFKSFRSPEVELRTLFQREQTQYRNHFSISYSVMVTPPNKLYTYLYQALLFRLICHAPIKNRVLIVNP
jgi:hypothetical protein